MADENNNFEVMAAKVLEMKNDANRANREIEIMLRQVDNGDLPIENYSLLEFLQMISNMRKVKDQYNTLYYKLDKLMDKMLEIC